MMSILDRQRIRRALRRLIKAEREEASCESSNETTAGDLRRVRHELTAARAAMERILTP